VVRTERLRRPSGESLLAGYNGSTQGRVRVRDRLVPRPTGGPVRLAFVPEQVSGRRVKAVFNAGRRSFAGLINLSSAPCHALPGRVGDEGSVNQAYDLAWCQAGWRPGRGDLRERRSNKRMQLTKGGWRRGETW